MIPTKPILHVSLLSLALIGLGGCDLRKLAGDTRCYTVADCDKGQVCAAHLCASPGTLAQGRKCTASRDCKSGFFCGPVPAALDPEMRDAQRCQKVGSGAAGDDCSSDLGCQSGLRCHLVGLAGSCAAAGSGDEGAPCQVQTDCIAGLYCGAGSTCQSFFTAFPTFTGVKCDDTPPFHGYFTVPRSTMVNDFLQLPFPNDARRHAGQAGAGQIDLSGFPDPGPTPLDVDLVKLYVDAYAADFDGFSPNAPVLLRFSSPLDATSVSAAGAVQLVDLTGGAVLDSAAISVENDASKYACQNRLVVDRADGKPLSPGHTFAVLVSASVRSATGETPAPDADWGALLAAARPGDTVLGEAWDAYAPLRAWVAAHPGTAPVTGTVFTVSDIPSRLGRLAAATLAAPAPQVSNLTVCGAGVTSPCDDGTPARSCDAESPDYIEIMGRVSMPIFQDGTAPYLTPSDGGGIADTGSGPTVKRTEQVCFALTVPKTAAPSGGWPLVVYGHGTGGSFKSFIGDGTGGRVATTAGPAATIGFDEVEHGARRGASMEKPDNLVFNVLNPRAARDNFLQGGADIIQAMRMAQLALSVGGQSYSFDPEKVAFFGHSQGSNSGALSVPFSSAPLAILSGAGSQLSRSLLEKTSPLDVKSGLQFLLGDTLTTTHPVMILFQAYFDRSDALTTGPLWVEHPVAGAAARHVYLSWGDHDTYSPSGTLRASVRSIGLPLAATFDGTAPTQTRPVSLNKSGGDGHMVTAVALQYENFSGEDGHFVAEQEPAAVADWGAFLSSWLMTGTPVLP